MNQVEQSVAEYVDEVWEDVVADIEQLVSYPSVAVAADAEPGAPFGRPGQAYGRGDVAQGGKVQRHGA